MSPITSGGTITLDSARTLSGDYLNYGERYNTTYMLNGFLKFKESKYASVRRQLYGTSSTVDNVKIDQEIESLWNRLSAAEQATWNGTIPRTGATTSTGVTSLSYDYHDLNSLDRARNRSYAREILSGGRAAQNNEVCPTNETPARFKARTGLTCYEICPPGRERDSTGLCIPTCYGGKVRDPITNTCVNRQT